MSFELTPDQRLAVLANEGLPLHIHDPESRKVFRLIEQGAAPRLEEEYIQKGLQTARDQIDRDELGQRSIDAIIVEARRRFQV